MQLSKKVKAALDETRILILGAQILVGFQFRGVFRDAYESLPAHARYLDALALLLMLITTGLLIAPGPYHRIVEEGRDTGRLHRVICTMARLALLPFAISLGLDFFIAGERLFGRAGGLVAGAAFAALALFFWYGLEHWRRRHEGHRERAMTRAQKNEVEETPLHTRIEQMLTEARVVLPGAQALLGFQLAIVVTESFEKLPTASKLTHAAALALVALTVILLMAPAAYHRIVYAGEDSEDFHRMGSRFVTSATVPLALGLAADIYVVIAKIAASGWAALLAAGFVLALLIGLWHIFPAIVRQTQAAEATRGRHERAAAE